MGDAERLECLEEAGWTFLGHLTHHVEGLLKPDDIGLDVEVGAHLQEVDDAGGHERDELDVKVFELLADKANHFFDGLRSNLIRQFRLHCLWSVI